MDDDGVRAIVRNRPDIKGLTFTDAEIGDGAAQALLTLDPSKVEFIQIKGCYRISPALVRQLQAKFGDKIQR